MQSSASFTYVINSSEEGKRLDVVLAKRPEIASRSFAQRLIKQGMVAIEDKKAGKSYRVSTGQNLAYELPEPKEAEVEAQNIALKIVYEDNDIAVINKPAGMVVHPSYGHWEGTLVNALLYHLKGLSSVGGVKRPGIVHRLDKNTSGLMLIAKNDEAHIALSDAIRKREVTRQYLAIVHGIFEEKKFSVEAPISRSTVDRKKMAVMAGGREAKTDAEVLEIFAKTSYLKLTLQTGRTHQIRVHLSYINHPVLGDDVYGRHDDASKYGITRPFLHAFRLSFSHPITNRKLEFEEKLPKELESVLENMRLTS